MRRTVRKKILVKGVVQGVGFRPHVYRLALERALGGWVRNDDSGVTIEAEGPAPEAEGFIRDLSRRGPAAARIDSVSSRPRQACGEKTFSIVKSGGVAAA